jgi:hypothetical protein
MSVSLLILTAFLIFPTAQSSGIDFNVSTTFGTPGTPDTVSPGEKRASAWVDPCPASSVLSPGGQMVDEGERGIGLNQPFQCDPDSGWQTIFVCYQRCPSGVPDVYIPPTPPQLWEIYAAIHRDAPLPGPLFAPPVERGGGIKAVVGKRLYINLTPDSFSEKDGNYSWDTTGAITIRGFWYARILYVPVNFEYTVDELTIGPCPGPGASGTTAAGRTALDSLKCSAVINNRPDSGVLPVTITTHWRVIVNTNVPNMARVVYERSSATFDVPVKELQAVLIN